MPPILIVGAGTTGFVLACVLARHGVPLRIIDKLSGINPLARAVGLQSRSLEIFQNLGLVDAIVDKALKINAVNQIANGERVLHGRFDGLDSPFPFLACLEQWKTESVLEAYLAKFGVNVERQTELVAIEERLDGVRASVQKVDGSTEAVDTLWLIGCDGAHSKVRHLNRQHFPGEADPTRYLVADVAAESPYPLDEVSFFLSDSGYFFWGPMPDGRIFVTAEYDESPPVPDVPPTLADVQALLDARSPERVQVFDPRWLGWYRTHYRLTPHYRHGRTFLAGDAAHIHSAVGGQGMNTGIQDAYNLGWKLGLVSLGRAPESLLDSYEIERRAIADDVSATTRAMTERLLSYSRLPQADRERKFRHAHVPEADRLKTVRHMAELDLDYRKSPICSEHVRAGTQMSENGPHAGAEAADVGSLQVAGRTLSLFELVAGPRHTLLLFAGQNSRRRLVADIAHLAEETVRVYGDLLQVCVALLPDADDSAFTAGPAAILRDCERDLHVRYGALSGGACLIRPDGYIGWRSDRPSLTALRDYLAKIFA